MGRLKGYPAWPSRVVDPDNVNQKVAKARPSTSPSIYCVQFFPVGDHAWLNARDIKSLPAHQIRAYLEESHRKKDGDLKKAYEIALNPSEWETRQSEYAVAAAEREDQLADEDEEDYEVEDEEEEGSKKRKAPSKSKAKTEKKAKVDKPKPASKPAKATKKTPASKQPESKSAPENQVPVDEDPLASDPVCLKVKDWRHKLQRAFLSKSLPTADDMDAQDEIFKAIEAYEDMTIDALQYSKIGKVMKKIVTLEGIPRNDELKITDRAKKLMDGWTDFIESAQNGANGHANGNGNGDSAPAAESSSKPKSTKSAKPESTKAEPKADAEASAADAKDAKDASGDVEMAEKKADGEEPKEEANGEAKKEEEKESEMPGAEGAVEA